MVKAMPLFPPAVVNYNRRRYIWASPSTCITSYYSISGQLCGSLTSQFMSDEVPVFVFVAEVSCQPGGLV